jgi:hypothetical protein
MKQVDWLMNTTMALVILMLLPLPFLGFVYGAFAPNEE